MKKITAGMAVIFFCSQGDAGLEDGEVVDVGSFAGGELSGGYVEDGLDELGEELIHGVIFEERAGIEVDPMGLAMGELAVGADFDGGDEGAEGGASSGGEEDELTAGGGEGGGGYEVVAWGGEEMEAGAFEPIAIGQDSLDG